MDKIFVPWEMNKFQYIYKIKYKKITGQSCTYNIVLTQDEENIHEQTDITSVW